MSIVARASSSSSLNRLLFIVEVYTVACTAAVVVAVPRVQIIRRVVGCCAFFFDKHRIICSTTIYVHQNLFNIVFK